MCFRESGNHNCINVSCSQLLLYIVVYCIDLHYKTAMLTLHMNGDMMEDSGENAEMDTDSPAKLIAQCCSEQTEKIQDDPEEVMLMKEEEEACELTQDTDLNSSSCLTLAQSSTEAIFDGMNVAEEAKSTSEERNTTGERQLNDGQSEKAWCLGVVISIK